MMLWKLGGGRSASWSATWYTKYEFPDILVCSSQRSFHFMLDQKRLQVLYLTKHQSTNFMLLIEVYIYYHTITKTAKDIKCIDLRTLIVH